MGRLIGTDQIPQCGGVVGISNGYASVEINPGDHAKPTTKFVAWNTVFEGRSYLRTDPKKGLVHQEQAQIIANSCALGMLEQYTGLYIKTIRDL